MNDENQRDSPQKQPPPETATQAAPGKGRVIDATEWFCHIDDGIRALEKAAIGGDQEAAKYLHFATNQACRAASNIPENCQLRLDPWAVYPLARQSLRALSYIAEHEHPHALTFLFEIAKEAIQALDGIATKAPHFIQSISNIYSVWPVLIGPSKVQYEPVIKKLKKLGVGGQETPFKLALKRQSNYLNKTPYRQMTTALKIIEEVRGWHSFNKTVKEREKFIEDSNTPPPSPQKLSEWAQQWADQAAKLSPLNHANANEWFEIVWIVILKMTDGKPEKDEELKPLGERRWDAGGQYRGRGRAPPQGTQDCNIRNGIKERMKEYFLETLVPKDVR